MDPACDPEVRHGGQCRRTMFTKQVSRPVDGPDLLSWPPRRSTSSELEERPGQAPDPRFSCPTSLARLNFVRRPGHRLNLTLTPEGYRDKCGKLTFSGPARLRAGLRPRNWCMS